MTYSVLAQFDFFGEIFRVGDVINVSWGCDNGEFVGTEYEIIGMELRFRSDLRFRVRYRDCDGKIQEGYVTVDTESTLGRNQYTKIKKVRRICSFKKFMERLKK